MAEFDFSKLSVGLNNLTEGYIDYAEEVIVNRALPALQDGLKPVHRRCLVTLHDKFKKGEKVKCADLAGSTLKLHPHGDASVYAALVLLTDRNGGMELPLLEGQGNFGNVCTTDPPAASRYTEVRLHSNAEDYFKDMAGATIVPSYDSSATEPVLLPVSYPSILCNAQEGIAVGFSCKIPSFNFNDVIDLTIEYIRDGKCSSVICPDFVTGGYYVKNNKELDKLMRVGTAKLKLRGKVTKVGKELTVVELPYGVKVSGLINQIRKANISGVRDCGDITDYENGVGVLIDCAKSKTDDVLLALYKDTDLQYSFPANLFVVNNGKPVRLGVWGIIEEWVKWRRAVVLKRLKCDAENIRISMAESRAFIEIFNDKEKLDEITHLILKVSDEAAIDYILKNFDNEIVTPELARWLVGRRINVFRTGGKYVTRYNELHAALMDCEKAIADVDTYIINELTALKAAKGAEHPRRTEITNMDYEFTAEDGEVQKDTTQCFYAFKDGFLRKSRMPAVEFETQFTASASDTLIALDNRGRVLRIYCEDLPYSSGADLGVYLPRYCNLSETDDYKITWIGLLDGSTKMLLYKDGNIGFLDMSEWVGLNRKVKVIEKGIAVSVADKLGAVIDIPDWLYVLDSSGRMGYVVTDNIKHKDRTAKTRVFNLAKGEVLTSYAPMSLDDGTMYVTNVGRYEAPKLQFLESAESLLGDAGVFLPMF